MLPVVEAATWLAVIVVAIAIVASITRRHASGAGADGTAVGGASPKTRP
jgi:hypothetical protein